MGPSVRLSERDLTMLLNTAGGTDADDGVTARDVLDAVAALVPCDVAFWNWYALGPPFTELALVDASTTRPVTRAPLDGWLAHLPEHPIMSGRHGPVVALSDILGPRELRSTWLYQEALHPDGLCHEIGVELPHAAGEMSVVLCSRASGRDFDERDHLTLHLLRPHLDAALRRLTRPPPSLTSREWEVMLLVRDGLTDAQVARRLGVVEATVSKHLEHIYARTGARSRVQAVRLCSPVLDGPPPAAEARRGPAQRGVRPVTRATAPVAVAMTRPGRR